MSRCQQSGRDQETKGFMGNVVLIRGWKFRQEMCSHFEWECVSFVISSLLTWTGGCSCHLAGNPSSLICAQRIKKREAMNKDTQELPSRKFFTDRHTPTVIDWMLQWIGLIWYITTWLLYCLLCIYTVHCVCSEAQEPFKHAFIY